MAMELSCSIPDAHEVAILCVAFNAERNEIFSGAEDCLIKVWDVESGHKIRVQEGHQGFVTDLLYADLVKMLFSCSLDGKILAWSDKGRLLQVIEFGGPVYCLAWDVKGKHIVGGGQGVVHLYKVLRSSASIYVKSGSGPQVSGMARFMNPSTFIFTHKDDVRTVCCSDYGNIFTAGFDKCIFMFDSSKPGPTLMKVPKCHEGAITAAAYDRDLRVLITGSYDGTVKVWSHEGHCIDAFHYITDTVTSIAYIPSTRCLWIAGKKRFPVIIDTIGPANVTEWAADTCSLSSLCLTKVYHATKKDLAIGLTVDNEILVWRYNQFGPQRQLNGHLDWVECLVIVHRKPPRISESDPTNEEMEQSRSSIEKESVVKRVTFLERRASMAVEKKASMANIKRLTSPKQEPTSLLYTEIYSASADGAILKWLPSPGSNTDSWTQFEVAPSCHVSILSMIYDPNLDVLITGSSDCKIRIWNLDGQRSTSSATGPDVLCGHEDSVVGLCIINHVLISISYDRTLRWWDMATYLPLETIEMEPEVALVCLEYSPSRNELATCGTGGMIQVRHARHGKKLYLLEGGSGNIILVKWCASGGTWVSASDDGEISIWDPVSQSRLRSMCKKKELVTALLVDEENKLILFSMINDHTIRGYTMDLEEEMCAYVGHADQVHCMVYLSEKSLYISGSWDKTLRTWIAPNKLRQQAVQRSMSTQKEDSLDGSGIFHEVTPISTYEKEHPLIIPKTLESLGPVLQKRPESPAPQKVPSSRGSIRGSIKGSRGSVRGSISGLTVFSRGSSSTGSETEEKKLTLAMKLDDLEESLNHSIPCLYQDDYFHQ